MSELYLIFGHFAVPYIHCIIPTLTLNKETRVGFHIFRSIFYAYKFVCLYVCWTVLAADSSVACGIVQRRSLVRTAEPSKNDNLRNEDNGIGVISLLLGV